MSSEPRVSVILASRNASATAVQCLDALRTQTGGVPFEVIIVDSSTDGTDEMIRKRYPEFRLLHFGERKFPGEARNLGRIELMMNHLSLALVDAIDAVGGVFEQAFEAVAAFGDPRLRRIAERNRLAAPGDAQHQIQIEIAARCQREHGNLPHSGQAPGRDPQI